MATTLEPMVVPGRTSIPVVLSVSHAGNDYPEPLLRLARVDLPVLRRLEDPLVDRLAWRALGEGAAAVIARAPRAFVDCNRSECDVDPLVADGAFGRDTGRARHGLGVVPTKLGGFGRLWNRPLSLPELEGRIDVAHRPFHEAVALLLEERSSFHGDCFLIDCHSMPAGAGGDANVVIGDRHGTTTAGQFTQRAMQLCRQMGLRPAMNVPYAGGHIVERHGRPWRGIHAIQVEMDRALYLDGSGEIRSDGFDLLSRLLGAMVVEMSSAVREMRRVDAAE